MADTNFDVIIIGGGIAGASLAAHLTGDKRTLILEQEDTPGYHSTGRSAALFSEIYGNTEVRALSRASREFFLAPPAGFADTPLLSRRGSLFIARAEQVERLESFASLPDISGATRRVSSEEAVRLCPLLRAEYVTSAVYEPEASDIEVSALHQGFLRLVRHRGGQLLTEAGVTGLERCQDTWRVETPRGTFRAPIIVNAAGAWVDVVARLALASPIGITPMRRTGVIADIGNREVSAAPLTIDIDELFYFKPDAGHLLISPADETPDEPCDVQPDELDVAIAIDRVQTATSIEVRRIVAKWAGLRCFVADRTPVIGYDPVVPGLFWLAALGGYGIQTAPAVGRLAATLVLNQIPPADILDTGLSLAALAPGRLNTREARNGTGG